jgi:hypothetical protein
MKIKSIFLFAIFPLNSFAAGISIDSSVVGDWQYPGRNVWVRIVEDGSAYQCRIAAETKIYASKGRLSSVDTIEWDHIWAQDQVTNDDGMLVLKGQYGVTRFSKSKTPMSDKCKF